MGAVGTSTYSDLSNSSYQNTQDWMAKNSNYDDWYEQMWEKEYDETIYRYTGDYYSYINSYLRSGDFTAPSGDYYYKNDADKDIKEIDYAISKFEFMKPLTVYRDSDTSLFGGRKMSYEQLKALEGATVTDKAYMSTSLLKDLPGEQTVGGAVSYRIDIPASAGKAAYIAKSSENPQEREVLVARNSQYKVKNVSKQQKTRRFKIRKRQSRNA